MKVCRRYALAGWFGYRTGHVPGVRCIPARTQR